MEAKSNRIQHLSLYHVRKIVNIVLVFFCLTNYCFGQDYDSKNDTNCKCDSIIINYWNLFGLKKYDSYFIIYSQKNETLLIYSDDMETTKNMSVYSIQKIQYLLYAINTFYLDKTIPIIEKKIKTIDWKEYDIPTISIECYSNKKRIVTTSTKLDDGQYDIIFTPKFIEFWNLLLEIIQEYDSKY